MRATLSRPPAGGQAGFRDRLPPPVAAFPRSWQAPCPAPPLLREQPDRCSFGRAVLLPTKGHLPRRACGYWTPRKRWKHPLPRRMMVKEGSGHGRFLDRARAWTDVPIPEDSEQYPQRACVIYLGADGPKAIQEGSGRILACTALPQESFPYHTQQFSHRMRRHSLTCPQDLFHPLC